MSKFVTYLSTSGARKTALVLATPEDITPDTNIPEAAVPAEGEANLLVFSATGQVYARLRVPSEAKVATLKAQGNEDYSSGGYFVED